MIEQGNRAVGMGRVIGDGGCFFQIVDIAVDPADQGQGLALEDPPKKHSASQLGKSPESGRV